MDGNLDLEPIKGKGQEPASYKGSFSFDERVDSWASRAKSVGAIAVVVSMVWVLATGISHYINVPELSAANEERLGVVEAKVDEIEGNVKYVKRNTNILLCLLEGGELALRLQGVNCDSIIATGGTND